MQVLKFGGGCLRDPHDLPRIIDCIREKLTDNNQTIGQRTEYILVVFSAIDKTTRKLEHVVDAYYDQKKPLLANEIFNKIFAEHLDYAKVYLNSDELVELEQELFQINDELTLILDQTPHRERAYYYDQIVCLGELLATTLISFLGRKYFNLEHKCLDARDFLRSNAEYSKAKIDYEHSEQIISKKLKALFKPGIPIFTQGFIASTKENESTTLGKEGSDFSAALFGHFLNADAVYLFKDVPGILDADPKWYPQAQTIKQLSYDQMQQIANLGASVVHPKSLKPLQIKSIPLYVVSFKYSSLPYSTINAQNSIIQQPICIRRDQQILINIPNISYAKAQPIIQQINTNLPEKKISLIEWQANNLSLILDESANKYLDMEFERGYSLLSIIGKAQQGLKKYMNNLNWQKQWSSNEVQNYLVRTENLKSLESRK